MSDEIENLRQRLKKLFSDLDDVRIRQSKHMMKIQKDLEQTNKELANLHEAAKEISKAVRFLAER